ncbi:putative membrane protein [Corynebacterium kroppenstedtii DSM 44385]|uniref:Putative membrane protein n=2 Tax=Corynebacterium kroppenstedtii TaxID=161879 RepID=C4LHG9_CORK4|nr:putative membrane protein [Corynebacterium kroppenstedtii DSM 44385]
MQPFPSQNDTQQYGTATPGRYHGPDDAPEYNGEPPLSQPFYGASLPAAVKRFVTRVLRFKGRSSRSEYWWVQLVLFLIYAVISAVAISAGVDPDDVTNPVGLASAVFSAIIFVPTLSLTWRRLHDAGFAGPWWFITFTVIAAPVLLIMTIFPSRPEKMKEKWDDKENLSSAV